MAYQIDFTSSNYALRSWRKLILRSFLVSVIVGVAWGVCDVYKTYNQSTLNMKLAEYEAVSRPIEEMNAAWDQAAEEYAALSRYYRLLWASSPTNFLNAMLSADASRLGSGLIPLRWKLTTGGRCKLDFTYKFMPGDKAEQVKNLETEVANAVTSVVVVVDGKVVVQGVQHENLLNVEELNITVSFSLPDVKTFPSKEGSLSACVNEIALLRKKVHDIKVENAGDIKGASVSASQMMKKYLPENLAKKDGKALSDFPDSNKAISVSGWLANADKFIAEHRIPADPGRNRLRAAWNEIGEARFPWDRYRDLDNDELVACTKELGRISDKVKQYKNFLIHRSDDFKKKLEPLAESYDRKDVFNKPFVESDLKGRVAAAVGVARAETSFRDEKGSDQVTLEMETETFSFSWVRWTMALGEVVGLGADSVMPDKPSRNADAISLAMLADCATHAVELGPGYALDSVNIYFRPDGDVAGAVLEGLLPVKDRKKKEATGNVD